MTGPCRQCGQEHVTRHGTPACTGHVKRDGGRPCANGPITGTTVCGSHGGRAPQVRDAARRRAAEQEAERQVATLGLPVDISPTEALLQEVHWTAGHVQWLRRKVQELETGDLVWGMTRAETEGGASLVIGFGKGDDGDAVKVTDVGSGPSTKVIETSGASAWYELYERERKHLVVVCSAALKAGVEERRVRLAESQGDIVAEVIRRILDGLYRALLATGLTDAQLRDAWSAAIADVVPRELRLIAGGA